MEMNRVFTTPEYIFRDNRYRSYIIKYTQELLSEVENVDGIYLTPIKGIYAILTIRDDGVSNGGINYENLKIKNLNLEALYIKYLQLYKLQDISPIEAANLESIQVNTPLNLSGKGVLVGIIDTGIDYLNSEFMTPNGKTRINFIWDQTIENKAGVNRDLPYGTEYNSEQINSAIELYKQGKDPYGVVPSKDEIGHGTNMASIIGATGINPELTGVAPNCEFCIVKLAESTSYKQDFDIKIPVFDLTSIFIALIRLYDYALKSLKPMVIYLPLGSNSGNHRGNGILNEIIQNISTSVGIAIVTGSGNEGAEGGHTSGVISTVGERENIFLNISKEQKSLVVEIWIETPNIMSLNIISPSGEDTGVIPVLINSKQEFNFIFEKVAVQVIYFIPEATTGDELILIYFQNLQPGTWKLRLTANLVTNGVFNAWIPVKGISLGDTAFVQSNYYGTFTTPGDSISIVTVAAYNQNNNNTLKFSGMAFKNDLLNPICIAAGGINQKTVGPNNKIDIVSGTSVSAAVVSGVCALMFQWGIIDGNFPSMYAESLITFLVRGAGKRRGDIYPNAEWGYGTLDVFKIFSTIP